MKNAADVRIALDVMDLVQTGFGIDEVVLASGDSDFTPLLLRLRMRGVRTVVMSAGQAARAYVSVADTYLDESGLVDLVVGVDESAATDKLERETIPPAFNHSPDRMTQLKALRIYVTEILADSSGAVTLAAVGLKARERFGDAVDASRWFGAGTLSAALGPEFHIAGHWLYDPARVDVTTLETGQERRSLHEGIESVERVVAMPRLSSAAWQALFSTLETYAATHDFNLTQCTAWVRDQLASTNTPVGRQVVGWVVRGALYGGAPLNASPPPTATRIAEAVLRNTTRIARQAQLQVSDTDYAALAEHFGLDTPPERENGDS
jgi:hypothetical protein